MAALAAAAAAAGLLGGQRAAGAGAHPAPGRPALREHADDLARILTLEMGKPLAESAAEVEFAADYLEWFAEEAVRIAGRTQARPTARASTS